MTLFHSLLIVASMHLVAVISPGPDFALVMRNSLAHTRRHAVLTALGIAAGIWVHVAYCMLGIALLLSQSPATFQIVRMAGGAYLAYLGVTALWPRGPSSGGGAPENPPAVTGAAAFRMGFLCNALNPKATVFFLGLFTVVLRPDAPKAWQLLYGLEMSAVTFAWFAFVGTAITHPGVKARIARFQGVVVKVMGAALTILGVSLLWPSG